MTRILVVGQTPPPFHGQAIMIESMIQGDYGDIDLCHVRMGFSHEIGQVGAWSFRKITELFRVIGSIVLARLVHGVRILYYPPAGPNIVPVLRDFAILIATRWLFDKTIFHFHAGGLSSLYNDLPLLLRFLFRKAYFKPDLAIRVSEFAPEDGKSLEARRECVVPNGVEDIGGCYVGKARDGGQPSTILFVGALSESKGVMVLLEACRMLRKRGITFRANLMGGFDSSEFEEKVLNFIEGHDLGECVIFLGTLAGEEKQGAFGAADVFCFPTYYGAETFGIVLIEAMSFGLPVVATEWRGIPGIVEDGDSGFLVPIRDASAVAIKLEKLILDPALCHIMGERGRTRYLQEFTADEYRRNMKEAFESVTISP